MVQRSQKADRNKERVSIAGFGTNKKDTEEKEEREEDYEERAEGCVVSVIDAGRPVDGGVGGCRMEYEGKRIDVAVYLEVWAYHTETESYSS
ncbi:hypothetical protein TWF718_007809 [Orbilia javanica]|uniref:Uncharacterized protein n=1 Tax=Orbilia javanica TaxID=47235 RepID=A0AAN8MV59_9PEZI